MALASRAMRRALLAAVSTAALLPAAPAHAIPSVLVVGAGTVSPGLGLTPTPQSLAFSATGTLVPGPGNVVCQFSGVMVVGTVPSSVGTMWGSCGPIDYLNCPFVMTPTTWNVVCPNSAGVLTVSWSTPNTFTASGLLL